MIKIGIAGACGKMGKRIAYFAFKDPDVSVSAAFDKEGVPGIGEDIGDVIGEEKAEIIISPDMENAPEGLDAIIEFTLPDATLEHLDICRNKGIPLVIGTTGLDDAQEEKIIEASKSIPIVFAPNMSAGVNVLFKIVKEAAKALAGDFSIKVDETHHVHKKDSPSGTAKMIGKVIAEGGGVDAPIEAFREGEVIGNHGIIFESEFETLEIRHDAKTRDVFAVGSIKAAKFLKGKSPGLYTMADVLGI